MNAPLAKEQIELLMSDRPMYRMSVAGASEATVPSVRTPGLVRWFGEAVRFVIELPRRRAVLDELARLSDRELADIGINRSDLKQVFKTR